VKGERQRLLLVEEQGQMLVLMSILELMAVEFLVEWQVEFSVEW